MFYDIENKGPLFWSWTKVLKFWILIFRNVPKIIEALSIDGSSGQQIESSKLDPLSGLYNYVRRLSWFAICLLIVYIFLNI